jgi:hypothetical protein
MVQVFDFRRMSRRGPRRPRPSTGGSCPDASQKNYEAALAWPSPLDAEPQAIGRGAAIDNDAVLAADNAMEVAAADETFP